jgi:hypothetical protein
MLKNLLAKLGLGRHAENESYGDATASREARRVQDGIDSSGRTPRVDDSPPKQTGEEPPTGSES